MARIGFLAENYGSFGDQWSDSTDRLMRRSGHNIGNFAFWRASKMLLGEQNEVILFPFGAKSDHLRGKVDKLVIPAANFLNSSSDFRWLAELIDDLDLPCVILGLGAQSERGEMPELKDGTIRFLKALSAHTPYMCLRGEFTRQVCEHYSINNVKVMGCPSILLSSNLHLGQSIESDWNRAFEKIAVHAANIKNPLKPVERYLFQILFKKQSSAYFVQRPAEFIKLVFNEELSENELSYLKKCHDFLASDFNFEEFKLVMKKYIKIPYSIDSWLFELRSFSHAIGTRIHGTIMSTTAELPAICITHDTRTKELCDALVIPHIDSQKIAGTESLSEIFDSLRMDGASFDKNRVRLAIMIKHLFKQVDIIPSKHVNNFIIHENQKS